MTALQRKIVLGCGKAPKRGFLNIDRVALPGVDMIVDLEKPLPFKDNTFIEAESTHVFEHIENFIPMMEELHRTCAPGAKLNIIVPYFANPNFWIDPTHRHKFNISTFKAVFTGDSYLSKARFRIRRQRIFFFSSRSFMKSRWYSLPIDLPINLLPAIYERFFVYMLPASELHIELEVEKEKKKVKRTP